MNAYKAKLIRAESSAVNYEGDKARSTATISSTSIVSSLVNYHTIAFASTDTASTGQSSGSAKGDTINFDTYSSNKEGDMAESYTSATKGEITSYSAKALGDLHEASAEMDKTFQANVPSGSIIQKMYAIKSDLASPRYYDQSETNVYLKNGYMQTKSAKSVDNNMAYASKYYDITYAYSSADFSLNAGGVAYSSASCSNKPAGGSLSKTVYAPSPVTSFSIRGWTNSGTNKGIQIAKL